MSPRFIKFLIIFLLIFSAQLIAVQFLLLSPQTASAALPRIKTLNDEDTKAKCPCSSQASTANEGVQLYIPIPWVTDGCGYVCDINNDGKANVVDYVVSIYKFLVGLAAIMAVIMIVWGGLLWIFSAGNPNKISTAKDTVVSAVIGLVLALVSVTLLQAINPALTNVELPDLTKIGRVTVSGIFATDEDIMLREEAEIVAFTQNNAEQKAEQRGITSIVPSAKAIEIATGSVSDLLDQEMKLEKDESITQCGGTPLNPIKKMCFQLSQEANKLGSLTLGSKLKCNSTVDVKVAHITFAETEDAVGKKIKDRTKIKSIECYHGLCDPSKYKDYDSQTGKSPIVEKNKGSILTFIQKSSGDLGINWPPACIRDNQTLNLIDCITPNEGKDVGSAFAYGQDCSEIGSTGLCLVEFGKGMDAVKCVDVKSLCESTDAKACDDVNNQIHNEDLYGDKFKDMGCARRYDKWTKGFGFAGGDNCVFGPYLYCPVGWNRVSYTMGEKGECWVEDKENKTEKEPRNFGRDSSWWHFIPLLGYPMRLTAGTSAVNLYVLDTNLPATLGTSAVCCQNPVPVNGQYQYKAIKEFWTISLENDLKEYNLDLENGRCKQGKKEGENAGENKKGSKFVWQEQGVIKNYTEGAIASKQFTQYIEPSKGKNEVSFCMNENILKVCYIPNKNIGSSFLSPFSLQRGADTTRGIFARSKLQDCINNAVRMRLNPLDIEGYPEECGAYLIPQEFCCIGETNCDAAAGGGDEGGNGGDESGDNPLVELNKKYPTDDAFKQGAEVINTFYQAPIENFTKDAEALLRSLAITESGGETKPDDSGKGYYGLMQINADEVQKHSQSPIQVAIPADTAKITPDWIETHPVESIQIATNYIVDMLNNPTEICPKQSTRYKDPEDPEKNRQCDYINEGDQDKYYSACQDALDKNDLKEKLKYIYAAYNGGAEANCHNVTNFNPSPPCNLCPLKTKGSIWECDANTGIEQSYEQTRGGALRMVDCYNQFKENLTPDSLTGCCSAGQTKCLESQFCPV